MKSIVSLIESPFEGGRRDVKVIINSYFSTQFLTFCLKWGFDSTFLLIENISASASGRTGSFKGGISLNMQKISYEIIQPLIRINYK